MRLGARAVLGLVAAVGLAVACAEYVVAPSERVVRGMQLDSAQFTIDEGQTLPIVATVLDQFDAPFTALPPGVAVAWSTGDTTVARVDSAGNLAGVFAGATQVGATVKGDFGTVSVSAPVTVRPLVSTFTMVAGDSQTGTVGQTLPTRLTVRLTNRLGAGVPRIPVTFTVVDSGGAVDTASATTDSTGQASAGWTLGTKAGTDSVQASTPRLRQTVLTFVAQATPGAVAALTRVSGDSQSAATGAPLAAPLVTRAVDRYGNAVPGDTVAWAVTAGGGSITPDTTVTGAQGTASAQWTLGAAPGTQTATASVGGVLTATFHATATAPVASVTVTPNPVTLASGSTQQLTATAKDAAGDVITGRTAVWTTSDATIASVSAAGLVSAGRVGAAAVTATVDGIAGKDSVFVTPGPVSTRTSSVTVTAPTVNVGGTVGLKLTTRDSAGDSVRTGGHTVVFTQSGGTSAGTIGPVTDNANGTYTATFTATTAGTPVTIGATIDGQAVTSAPGPTIQVNAAASTLVHWINTSGGLWSGAANWNPARVPTLQDTAVVDAAGTYTVQSNGDSVGGLVVGPAAGNGAGVWFAGASRIRGNVEVHPGSWLDAGSTLFVGAIRNDGELDVDPAAVVAVDTTGTRTAANYGTIYLNNGGALNVSRTTGLVNHGLISLETEPGIEGGSPVATATVTGDVTFGSGSAVAINLEGYTAGRYSVLGITGKATLGDTLRVALVGGFGPSAGQTFIVMVWTSFSGTFSSVQLPALTGGQWQVSYTPVGLMLSVKAGAPASVYAYQGDGLSGTVGTVLPVAPAVRVIDAGGNGVPGQSVTFAVASGGGSVVAPATVLTDSNGVATVGGWQLGATPGTNTMTATVAGSGIAGNPVTFTATGTTPTLTWTGAVSTDWSNPNNWTPVGVPAATGDVFIGATGKEPVLTGPSAARTVTIQGSGAYLTIGGQTLTATTLDIASGGLLVMTNPADVVSISGNVDFSGGNELNNLSAGQLQVGGTFFEGVNGSNASYAPTGTHTLVLTGSTLQEVTFVDLTGASHLQNLDISRSAGANIQFDYNGLVVAGTFTSEPTGPATPMVYGLGRSLSAQQVQVSRLVVDEAPLIVSEGSTIRSQQLDSVTFQGFRMLNGTAPLTQLTVVTAGGSPSSEMLTFTGLSFTPLSSGDTGLYVNLNSLGGSTVLDVVGAHVANGPAFTSTSGAATVNWQ